MPGIGPKIKNQFGQFGVIVGPRVNIEAGEGGEKRSWFKRWKSYDASAENRQREYYQGQSIDRIERKKS